jgi:hypothetical protein
MDEHPDYEYLCRSLYAYQFGAITFLELVERFEQALGIKPSDPTDRADNDLAEGEAEPA